MTKKEYYSVREISEKYSVNTKTIYAWIRQGKLKAIKLGGVVRVPESAIQEFLQGK